MGVVVESRIFVGAEICLYGLLIMLKLSLYDNQAWIIKEKRTDSTTRVSGSELKW